MNLRWEIKLSSCFSHAVCFPVLHISEGIQECTKWNLWKAAFKKIWSDMVCLDRAYHFSFFKGCLLQILLGPFLNTWPISIVRSVRSSNIFRGIKKWNIFQYCFQRCFSFIGSGCSCCLLRWLISTFEFRIKELLWKKSMKDSLLNFGRNKDKLNLVDLFSARKLTI